MDLIQCETPIKLKSGSNAKYVSQSHPHTKVGAVVSYASLSLFHCLRDKTPKARCCQRFTDVHIITVARAIGCNFGATAGLIIQP